MNKPRGCKVVFLEANDIINKKNAYQHCATISYNSDGLQIRPLLLKITQNSDSNRIENALAFIG